MKKFSAFILLAFAVISSAIQYVQMESSLFHLRDDFVRKETADTSIVHEVIIAVKQKNLDMIEKTLYEVSDPRSPKYGKFLTRAQIGELTVNREATTQIESYLAANGATIVKTTPFGEYITAKAPISVWQTMFATTFYNFEHIEKKTTVQRSMDYSVPTDISLHVEAVFGTVQLPHQKTFHSMSFGGFNTTAASTMTAAKLNDYYHIPSNTGNNLASQSLYESLEQYYSPNDLTAFQKKYNLPVEAVAADVGGYVSDQKCIDDANNCAEANLDVQYIMAVAQGVPTTYWYDDTNDAFVHWIEAVAASSNPPLVHSMSYGALEPQLSKSEVNSFNTEAMKLGAQGVTIVASSGDDGVANFQARSAARKCGYTPSFPASSPYVFAIGGTQGPESAKTEIACQADQGGVITTGGGFSTVFAAPSYQADAVKGYFAGLSSSQKPASGYSTTGRGYPDVSMAALNYEVIIGGKPNMLSGTSASAPVVAGMISLVNSARLKAGKSALGFVNPAVYQNGAAIIRNDITSGNNKCAASSRNQVCCTQGFYATAGWDPVTGFGSLDFTKFSNIFSKL
jgi:tripeptidyl-peptidase-1